MSHIITLIMAVVGFAIVFTTHSPGLLGLGIALGLIGVFGFIFSLASARISANARPEATMASTADVLAARAARGQPAPRAPVASPRTPAVTAPPPQRRIVPPSR